MCLDVTDTAETYVAAATTVDINVKVRADLLDVKVLVAVRDACEQWAVHRKAAFPVAAAVLRDDLFVLLGLAAPTLRRDAYSLPQLVDEVVGIEPALTVVEVTKRRRRYAVDACAAEVADVTIAGRRLQTVAVESVDLAAVAQARRTLGLEHHDNVSYPRAIRGTLAGRFG